MSMRNVHHRLFSVLGVITVLAAQATGQQASERALTPSIRVTGEAVATVKPDQVQVEIGVLTQAQSAQAAASQNAKQLETVIAELRKALGPSVDIKTLAYALNPNYRYPKEGGQPTITGYTAINVVEITINDLAEVGKVIDLATRSGANNIQRLQFTIKDVQEVQSQALRGAARKAKVQAEVLAQALGLKVVRVLSVEESGPSPRPVKDVVLAARAESFEGSTPVEPGTIELRAIITLTVEVSER
jgi:uncharacterized protein YggE